MAQEKGEYRVGRGKPPLHTRFRKGRSGNPRGPRKKDLAALLLAALNEPVTADKDGRRRRISKREAIVAQLVDKSADADLRATKMLIDMLQDIERKVAPPPEAAAETRRSWKISLPGCGVTTSPLPRRYRRVRAISARVAPRGSAAPSLSPQICPLRPLAGGEGRTRAGGAGG